MDILCVGMYRACSTWQYDVAAHMLETHRHAIRLGYRTGDEYTTVEPANASPEGSYRILKSHEEHPSFRSVLATRRALGLYAFRDLRDVVYSLMHKRQQDFDTVLAQGMIHQILANDRFWRAQPGILVQRYEDLIADPIRGIKDLARFLGVTLEPGEAAQLADQYSLDANRRRSEDLKRRLNAQGINLNDPANAQHADDQTLLHWNHVREGRTGSWREQATPRERRLLAHLVNNWLARNGYMIDDLEDLGDDPCSWNAAIRDRVLVERGWTACRLRCLSLRHPRLARKVKGLLGISSTPCPRAIPVGGTIATRVISSDSRGKAA